MDLALSDLQLQDPVDQIGSHVQAELAGFGLRVAHSAVKGRHIVANRDFAEGDLVGCFFPLQSAILDNYKKRQGFLHSLSLLICLGWCAKETPLPQRFLVASASSPLSLSGIADVSFSCPLLTMQGVRVLSAVE